MKFDLKEIKEVHILIPEEFEEKSLSYYIFVANVRFPELTAHLQ